MSAERIDRGAAITEAVCLCVRRDHRRLRHEIEASPCGEGAIVLDFDGAKRPRVVALLSEREGLAQAEAAAGDYLAQLDEGAEVACRRAKRRELRGRRAGRSANRAARRA